MAQHPSHQHADSDVGVVEEEYYGKSCHGVEVVACVGCSDELLVLPGRDFQDHYSAADDGGKVVAHGLDMVAAD